ncbi:hypothetical protein B4119_2065 [Parageobacillus caldoxylosilyticus]|jgi:hypothetical protein|uniref:Uncharacterized protein n=1 Tax=Saccharococcus caldoxylosilyticus TaxID=81408 RepID=A0A150LBC3_9BACL|nr:hypothetical protein B4119_2065 [Parageobacillus caldoxylosilyticus]
MVRLQDGKSNFWTLPHGGSEKGRNPFVSFAKILLNIMIHLGEVKKKKVI